MNKCWYAVYTKPQCEKKVSAQLTRKKIEHLCPLNKISVFQNNRRKLSYEPLFPSLVFVFVDETEIAVVKQTSDVMNFLYWLGKPAVIQPVEIEQLLNFSGNYNNIRLQKAPVNPGGQIKLVKEPTVNINEGLVTNQITVHLTLPSLGCVLAAEVEKNVDVYAYGRADSKLVI